MPSPAETLPGRSQPIVTPGTHTVLGTPLAGPWPEGTKTAIFGLGCFWGAEKAFWQLPGVVTTAVGYAGGTTPNPTYEEVVHRPNRPCRGRPRRVRPDRISYEQLLKMFWEDHDPTQVHASGQRRRDPVPLDHPHRPTTSSSASPKRRATRSRRTCRRPATERSRPRSERAGPFYYAEDYHQQYLDKNPRGYCPIHSTGVTLPADFKVTPLQYVE